MLNKPTGCSACPLRDTGKGFVPDKISPNPDYVAVGEAPGKHEVEAAEPFVGQAGFVLKNWLLHAVPQLRLAFEQGKISFVNTLRCLPPEKAGRAYPSGEEKLAAEKCCSQYDNYGDAKTIILFGEHAQRKHFGTEMDAEDASDRRLGREVKGVSGRIGRVVEKDGRRWVFAPHPAWILRQPALVLHGQEALKIASNTERNAKVEYVAWETIVC